MKITRMLTYNIDEKYIRNFFDDDWWENKIEPDESDYDFFIDGIREEGYDDEEIVIDRNDKERINQIWQEECDKYKKEHGTRKEQVLNELQYYKSEMEYYKNKIAQLEKWLEDA